MKKAILATKVGMTQIFNADGVLVPVTVLEAGPCAVTQIKTVDNDGYSAVQVAFADKKERIVSKDANGKKEIKHRHGVNKAEMGHFQQPGQCTGVHQAWRCHQGRYLCRGRQDRRDCDFQGKRIPGCDQETWTAQRADGSRFQVPSPPGFQRCMFFTEPCV